MPINITSTRLRKYIGRERTKRTRGIQSNYTTINSMVKLALCVSNRVEHKLTESAMAVAVQAHTQGFIQLDGIVFLALLSKRIGKTSKSKKSPKEIDTLRIKFRRIIIEKYSFSLCITILTQYELANELGTRPITKKSLPKHFFTNHLKDLGWRLEGVSDVMGMKDVKDIKMDRMKQIIAGLEEGNVRFVDLGVNL